MIPGARYESSVTLFPHSVSMSSTGMLRLRGVEICCSCDLTTGLYDKRSNTAAAIRAWLGSQIGKPHSSGCVVMPQNTHVMPGSKPDFEGRVRLVDESLSSPEAKTEGEEGEEAGKEGEGGKKPFWKKALKVSPALNRNGGSFQGWEVLFWHKSWEVLFWHKSWRNALERGKKQSRVGLLNFLGL